MIPTFGEYIKRRRTELGFPLKKIALHLDIDTSTLGKIEREERNLSENLGLLLISSRNKRPKSSLLLTV